MTNIEAIAVLDSMKVKLDIPNAAVTQRKRNEAIRTYDEVDRITLKDAFENPVPWQMIWAGEPSRQISVQMTYADLSVIINLIRKAKTERMAEIEEEKYRQLENEIER